ncbi:hypothetical protein C2869_18255 [Saccharobesus litoralis]|uniref:Agarase n=1 Tax=Saccharobesus litoralis TaxID=2172099 RepID=A0A2S0VVL6_9ALTE|nr:hypothetical protein [Saccharobesus litoralis]AWB68235.1 hypothetical protein C2869_18255 [Saccharobesus litoralis]
MSKSSIQHFALSASAFALLIACGGGGSTTAPDTNNPPAQKDTTPNSFKFTDQVDVPIGQAIESNTLTIGGINSATAISVSGGEFKIDNGSYQTSAATIESGSKVTVRGISSNQYQTSSKVTLTIGGVSDSFDLTTIAKPPSALTVDVNLDIRHIKGGQSEFDRSKFITIHAQNDDREWPDHATRDKFLEDYDVYFGRTNGALPWQLTRLKAKATNGIPLQDDIIKYGNEMRSWYKNRPDAHKHEHRMANMMYGGQPSMYPIKEHGLTCKADCKANDWLAGYEALGDYYSDFLTHYFGQGGTSGHLKPKIIEVLNEPFVHSGDVQSTNANISRLHSVVAKAIHEDHPDVKVGGFTAAYPQHEAGNFAQWDNTWKTFIDIAGDDMDFYSIHIYDNADANGVHKYRVGANAEAILDMIEHYSYLKIGEVKPWVISEFGYFSPHDTNKRPYSKQIDWYNVRSFSTFMLSLMERQDQIISAIPFHILKALWYDGDGIDETGYRYGTRLFILQEELDGSKNVADSGNWIYSEILKFYQLWADVKGTRVDSQPNDIDILADAYVDQDTLYLAMANLDTTNAQTIALNLVGANGANIQAIQARQVYWDASNETPVFDEKALDKNSKSYQVEANATAIIAVTFDKNIEINQTSTESRYYADKYKQAITKNTPIKFNIDAVSKTTSQGEAVLRIGLGRAHNLSLTPTLMVNGTTVTVPDDFRGYDQKVRDSFFGVIEVPVSYELLQQNNEIELTFDDASGFVTSMVLQVFEQSKTPTRS